MKAVRVGAGRTVLDRGAGLDVRHAEGEAAGCGRERDGAGTGGGEVVVEDDGCGRAIGDDRVDPLLGRLRRERDRDRAAHLSAEEGGEEAGAVVHDDEDVAAALDAAPLEEHAAARGLVANLRVGVRLVLEDEVRPPGGREGAPLEEIDEVGLGPLRGGRAGGEVDRRSVPLAHDLISRAWLVFRNSTVDAFPSSLTLFTRTSEPGSIRSSASIAATPRPPVSDPT